MHKLEKKVYYVIFILTALVVVIGLSYAYYVAQISGNESSGSITSNTATLSLTFGDGSGSISGSNIAPGWSDTKTFSITNTGNATNYYDLRVSNIASTFTIDGSIGITITSSDGGANVSERAMPLNTQSIAFGISIAPDVTHNYTIKVEYKNLDVDQSADLGASFSFNLGIITSINPNKEILLSRRILGDSNSNVGVSVTTAGRQISKSGEAVLASTTDDYGISYYYRGSVENNYIIFANMCWRIVRITGNGAIKIVLNHFNPSSLANPCDDEGGSNYAFARFSGGITTTFNINSQYNAYVGFMYGNPGSSTYEVEHANINKSNVLQILETWYNEKLSTFSPYLADTIWCNDKSIDTVYQYGTILGYGDNQTGYSVRERIYANNTFEANANPTLICPNDTNGGRLSKFTMSDTTYGNGDLDYKIGLMTADEVAYAGGRYWKNDSSSSNTTYYLYENAGTSWWTMSAGSFNGTSSGVWYTGFMGYLAISSIFNAMTVRPAVSLVATTKVNGSGTRANPYILVS